MKELRCFCRWKKKKKNWNWNVKKLNSILNVCGIYSLRMEQSNKSHARHEAFVHCLSNFWHSLQKKYFLLIFFNFSIVNFPFIKFLFSYPTNSSAHADDTKSIGWQCDWPKNCTRVPIRSLSEIDQLLDEKWDDHHER